MTLHRLGPRLQNVELAIGAVFAPFNIHRAGIVLLDFDCDPGEFRDFVISQGKPMAVTCIDVDGIYAIPGPRIVAVDHLDRFAAEVLAQYRIFSIFQCRLVDIKLVRVYRPLNDSFSKTIR